MTTTQYLMIVLLIMSGIIFSICALFQLEKLDKQIKELKKENEAMRSIRSQFEESRR